MNAAAPWRDDLENAPRDRMLRLLCRGERGNIYELWSRFEYAKKNRHTVICWADINQAEKAPYD